jgi:hypothetical protein
MATPKSWTAHDVSLGALTMSRIPHPDTGNPAVNFQQRYVFLDSGDQVLFQVVGGRYVDDMELADIPQAILDALQTIDNWLYQQCLQQEGMD